MSLLIACIADDERIHNYYDPTVAEFGHVLGGKLDLLVPMASFYDFLREVAGT
jgi:hypothetical protein